MGEGAEWDERGAGRRAAAARAGAHAPRRDRAVAADRRRAAGRRCAAVAAPPPDIAAEAAELGARYARLSRADQLALLARARELS